MLAHSTPLLIMHRQRKTILVEGAEASSCQLRKLRLIDDDVVEYDV